MKSRGPFHATRRSVVFSLLLTIFVLTVAGSAPIIAAANNQEHLSRVEPPLEIKFDVDPPSLNGLRQFPVFTPGGWVEKRFHERKGLEFHEIRAAAITELLIRTGLERVLDYGSRVAQATIQDVKRMHEERLKNGDDAYPYSYRTLFEYINRYLAWNVALEDLVDLSALIILDLNTTTAEPECPDSCFMPSAAVAYSLLTYAAQRHISCEGQLNLLYLLSLGLATPLQAIESESLKAQETCTGDVTPAWLAGQTYLGAYVLYGSQSHDSYPEEHKFKMADHWFAELQDKHPDSPLGAAGRAELRLKASDLADWTNFAPFQVRAWRRDALKFSLDARQLSRSPSIARVAVSALAVNGLLPESAQLAAETVKAEPTAVENHRLLIDGLAKLRDPEKLGLALSNAQMAKSSVGSAHRVGTPYGVFLPGAPAPRDPYNPAWMDGVGGADVVDEPFLPRFGRWPLDLECVDDALGFSLLASQQYQRLSEMTDLDWPSHHNVVLQSQYCLGRQQWHDFALIELGDFTPWRVELTEGQLGPSGRVDGGGPSLEEQLGELVRLWQGANDLRRARSTLEVWLHLFPRDWTGLTKLAEVYLASGDAHAALPPIVEARDSLDRYRPSRVWGVVYGVHDASSEDARKHLRLLEGTAYERSGDTRRARESYLLSEAEGGSLYPGIGYLCAGTVALRVREFEDAQRLLERSIEEYREVLPRGVLDARLSSIVFRGAQANNLALAAIRNGDATRAVEVAQLAHLADPASPIYLDTLALAYDLSGESQEAISTYRLALSEDASSYVTSNNLAVTLAASGDLSSAREILENALDQTPDYAIGWHNLGAILARSSTMSDFLLSQAAHARASRLDHRWRGEANDLETDVEVYTSNVDTSKAVAGEWTYSKSANLPSRPLNLTILILGLFQIAWAVGIDRLGAYFSERILTSNGTGPFAAWRDVHLGASWGVMGSAVLLTAPLIDAHAPVTSAATVAMCLLICLTPIAIRRLFTATPHSTWPPSVAMGALGAPFGYALVPYPAILSGTTVGKAARWSPSLLLAGGAMLFGVVALQTGMPYVRGAFAIASTVLASMFVPIAPFDGSYVSCRLARLCIGVALTGCGLALQLQWL